MSKADFAIVGGMLLAGIGMIVTMIGLGISISVYPFEKSRVILGANLVSFGLTMALVGIPLHLLGTIAD